MRRLEVKLQRLLQIGESFFFGLALTGNIHFQALRDLPLPLTFNCRREWSLHDPILPQGESVR
jgi:hypothetical protein